ncbi:MAG: methionine--tRNA ligase [Bdellovibrionota bacterium]
MFEKDKNPVSVSIENSSVNLNHEPFYITTPIYYPNSVPHLGHAYTTIVADVVNKYQKFFGRESFFMTGTDEHGQKVYQAAEKQGVPTIEYVNKIVSEFQTSWDKLKVNPNHFMRTTDPSHKRVVTIVLDMLYKNGDIYKKDYEGWYCVSEEIFYTEKDLVDGKTPTGKEVALVTEENYFFRMSKYQERLVDYIKTHDGFINPPKRMQEVLGFLREPISDLCISRPKSRVNWGIELPFDKDFVTYVWFDALLNYVSGIGYENKESNDFYKFWSECHHLIGKDILITHAVYWPTMLMAMGLSMPKQIFAHGWWLNSQSEKMSKSEGDVVSPTNLADKIGVDSFRYFICTGGKFGNDITFDTQKMKERLNDELANTYGNLVSRVHKLAIRDFDGKVPVVNLKNESSKELLTKVYNLTSGVQEKINELRVDEAILSVIHILKDANKYFGDMEPWSLAKQGKTKEENECLYVTLESLRCCSILLMPVMPEATSKVLELLNIDNCDIILQDFSGLNEKGFDIIVKEIEPLFSRLF